MIEVSIWYGNIHGDSVKTYLIESGDGHHDFKTSIYAQAAKRAIDEFWSEEPSASFHRIDVRTTPNRVLKP